MPVQRKPIGTALFMGPVARTYRKWQRRWSQWRAFLKVGARFTAYLRKREAELGFASALAIALMLMRLLEPWPLKLIIDNVLLDQPLPRFLPAGLAPQDGDPLPLLYALVAAILVIAFARGLFYYRQRLLVSRLGIEMTAELRYDLYRHIQHLSLSFHDRRRTGDLLVRLTSDIRILREMLLSLPLQVIEGLLLMLGMGIVMLLMDWQLAILALALLPFLAVIVRKYHRPMRRAVRKQREREGQLATMASEALGAIRVVQGFRREEDEIKRFAGANRSSLRSEVKAARYEALLQWSTEMAIAVVVALVVALATRRILAESLSPGDLIVFVAYLRAYLQPFRRVSRGTLRVARATAGGERILEILETEPAVHDLPGAVSAPRLRGEILFEGVSFGYGKRRPAISDVNLRIKAGERVAIVGPTGSGKSTIASLIPRFYDPEEGRVCIDGRDIREYTLASLRKQISLVFQEPVLFATTITENIAYGKPEASMEDVVKAARRAGIDRIICRLREGYDTVIGERGGMLSGGQRQCVAIARAMIRKSPIVILDEPTTGLDAEFADLVMKAIHRLMEGRTVLMISHDLNNVRDADRVIVLDRGRIVDEGSPSILATREGFYRDSQRLQAGEGAP